MEDFKKFLGFIAAEGDKAEAERIEETVQKTGMSKELIDKLGGPGFAEEFKVVEKKRTEIS